MSFPSRMDGEVVKDGVCYLAPGGVQMRVVKSVARTVIRLGGTEKISGHCPSCDELFTSVSEQFSENAMPEMSGLEALNEILKFDPQAKIVMITTKTQHPLDPTALRAACDPADLPYADSRDIPDDPDALSRTQPRAHDARGLRRGHGGPRPGGPVGLLPGKSRPGGRARPGFAVFGPGRLHFVQRRGLAG